MLSMVRLNITSTALTLRNNFPGRNRIPATEYLKLVWQTFAASRKLTTDVMPVVFENCKFIRAATVPESGYIKLLVMVQRGTGKFEILEKNSLLVSGRITICSNLDRHQVSLSSSGVLADGNLKTLQQDDIYREFHLRGYNYRYVVVSKLQSFETFL